MFPSTRSVIEISRNLKRNDTNSVEIVASDSLSPSWWCFKRFSTANAGLKSRLRHRICQKHSRKCANFLQFDILNKILHANYGYKFTKKSKKIEKSETVSFFRHSDNLPMEFPPPPFPLPLNFTSATASEWHQNRQNFRKLRELPSFAPDYGLLGD